MKEKTFWPLWKTSQSLALGLGSLLLAQSAWAWPDLLVVKSGPTLAASGDLLTYTLKYTNAGPQTSTSVVLKDFLPNYVTVQTGTVPNSGTISGSTVTWNIGTVAANARGSRSFAVRVNTNSFVGLSLTNRAQIFGSEAEEPGKTNNNYSTLITQITNRPPTALNDSYVLTENSTLTIAAPGILANDSDADGNALTAVKVSNPTHGTLTLNSNGSFSYQPAAGFEGSDSFTYRANDGQANSAVATVALTVLACHPSVDVMLVIDRSGSMKGQPYADARLACSNFVQNLHLMPNADQAGLASYNSAATLDRKLTNNVIAVKQAVAAIPAADGYTSISLGLQSAQTELASGRHNPAALPVILLLSDGLPTGTDNSSNVLFAATQAKNAGTRVFTVGLGTVDHALMTSVASYPSDYFYTTNSADLTALFNAISTVICRPPTNIFTAGPSNLTLCPGMTATFNIAASGCDAFTYQWTKGGVRLAGQTNSSMVIPNVSATNGGVYAVEVHSNCQSVTNSATLTVNSNVTAAGPGNQTNCTGSTVSFSTTASGTGPYTYQWLKNGSLLPNQTNANLTLSGISANDGGNYSVVVRGACGLPVTNTASLVVTPLPVISGVTNRTVVAGTSWTFDLPTANYPIVVVSTTTNNICGDTFTATRIWRTTDPCGSSAQTSQTVSVLDRTLPVITCPANLTLSANDGNCSRSNVTFTVTATDNCTVSTVTSVPPSGSTFPVGVTTVTSTATDASGNQSSCTFTVTVTDSQLPTITCPALVTVNANNGQCAATNVILGTPIVSDNCGVASVTNNAPASFPVGTNFVTWTVKDGSSNSATCIQTVIVRDTQLPTITCPTLVTVNANNGQCAATNVVLGTPTVSDNCGVASVTNNAPTSFPVGTNVVIWTVKDSSGNTANCSQTVIVRDTQLPTIICPALVTVNANNGQCAETNVVLGTPTVSDNCGVASVTNNAPASFPVGTNFVTWTVKDNSGNTASCLQTVIVNDTQAPTITCPVLVTINANNGQCSATNVILGTPTVGDNCGVASITNNAPATFPVGTNFVTWTVKDSSGNTANCTQLVIVRDTQLPTINCPALVTVNANNGQCAATNVVLGTPTVSDNCGVASVTNNAPASFPVGTNFVTWTVKDSSGNTANCSQTVIVRDTQLPTITCPVLVTVNANNGQCAATNVVLGTPTVTDNCGVASVTNNAPASFPVGTNFVTWTVKDSSGNTANCSQTVIVRDTQLPTITCPALVTVNANNGQCAATNVVLGTPTVTDNCGVASVTNNAPTSFPVGTNLVIWTVKDSSGNTANCMQLVIVKDIQAPQITCPAQASKTFEVGAPWTFDNVSATDACGAPTITSTTSTNLGCGNTYTATRVWRATDASGNFAECSQTVFVVDTTPPTVSINSPTNGQVFISPADFTALATAQDTNGTIARVEFFAGASKFGESTNGSPYFAVTNGILTGNYILTAKATDACGNATTSAPVNIIVIDRPPLTILSTMRLNPATSLFEIKVRVHNPTYSTYDAVRVYVENLQTNAHVYNPSGVTNGIPYVETKVVVPPNTSVDFVIEFYTTGGTVPNPTLRPQLIAADNGGSSVAFGAVQPLHRALLLPNRTFLVEFPTVSNRVYAVLYSSDLSEWKSAQPAVTGNGTWYQWIDSGLPKTESAPSTTPTRFYRVILLP